MKKLISMTMLSLLSTGALATLDSPYTMAVIKGSDGAEEIRQGLYKQGIADIASNTSISDYHELIAMQMNLCVAYANTYDLNNATEACDKAIDLTQKYKRQSSRARKVAALALNNRAILKVKSQDYEGALEDLMQALDVKNDAVIKRNLFKIKQMQTSTVQLSSTQSSEA